MEQSRCTCEQRRRPVDDLMVHDGVLARKMSPSEGLLRYLLLGMATGVSREEPLPS